MKTLIVIGVLLTITGATLASNTGISGAWMFQAGIILLLGALTIFARGKSWDEKQIVERIAMWSMVLVFIWGFFSGMWSAHPLGVGLVGIGWIAYRLTKSRPLQSLTLNMQSQQKSRFFQSLTLNMQSQQQWLQYLKWLMIPIGILLVLWLLKSIWIAFAVGFGIVMFLDRQSIQEKGLNRIAILLIVYLVGFLLLLLAAFKVADTYFEYDLFFSRDAYIFLRKLMRGL